jgi:hypothetical protein
LLQDISKDVPQCLYNVSGAMYSSCLVPARRTSAS